MYDFEAVQPNALTNSCKCIAKIHCPQGIGYLADYKLKRVI